MKVRKNFVSNSSSSSFVVAFPSKPRNEIELRNMMFTQDQSVISLYYDKDEDGMTVGEIACIVFREINDQGESASLGQIEAELYRDEPQKAKEFSEKHKDHFILCTEYEDHGKQGSIMEHGDIFDNLDHIRVSNH